MAPSQPCLAISIECLAFYPALFEQSCDAINTLALALHAHYICPKRLQDDKSQGSNVPEAHSLAVLTPQAYRVKPSTNRFGGV